MTENGWHILENLVTIAGWGITAGLLIWQMGKQHGQNLSQQREADKTKLRVEVYQALNARIDEAIGNLLDLNDRLKYILIHLLLYWREVDQNAENLTVNVDTAETLRDSKHKADKSIAELKAMLDSYEIIFSNPHLCRAFGKYGTVKGYAFINATGAFIARLRPFLPSDSHTTGIRPTPDDIKQLHRLGSDAHDQYLSVKNWIIDMVTSFQNELLGEMTGHKVSPRLSSDPVFVIQDTPACLAEIDKLFIAWENGKRALTSDVDEK